MIDEDLGRIDLAPAFEIVIRKSNHGGGVAGGLGPEKVARAILHRRIVNDAAVIREFAEGGAERLPGADDGGSERGAEAGGGDVI